MRHLISLLHSINVICIPSSLLDLGIESMRKHKYVTSDYVTSDYVTLAHERGGLRQHSTAHVHTQYRLR